MPERCRNRVFTALCTGPKSMIVKLFLKKGLSAVRIPVLYAPLPGSLAQLVEQLAFNQLVAGSNPARPTSFSRKECVIANASLVTRVEQMTLNNLIVGSNTA